MLKIFIGSDNIKLLKYLTILSMFIIAFLFAIFIIPNNNQYLDNNKESDISMSESVTNYENKLYENKYQQVSKKVVPYIVYANVNIDGNIIKGEVIEDKGNGTTYCININEENKWFSKYYVNIVIGEEIKLQLLTNEEIEFYVNYQKYTSKTPYFIWVDIYRNETYILKNINNYFFMEKRLQCATGANVTPTKRGLFEITNKGTHFYGRDNTYICYNYLQYSGSYLLHSFPYSFDKKVLDDSLKARVSNGCVRFTFDDSKYLYDMIPIGTTIWLN